LLLKQASSALFAGAKEQQIFGSHKKTPKKK